MLDLWLSERVKELTGGRHPPPTTSKPETVPDFPWPSNDKQASRFSPFIQR